MSIIDERKADRTGRLLHATMVLLNEEAAEASIVHYAYKGTDPSTQIAENAAIESATAMRWVYALYVAEGICPLDKLQGIAVKSRSAGARGRLHLVYVDFKTLMATW